MISFCDFLFKEGHYERCIITSFQLLVKLEDEPVRSVINYYIARSYEEIEGFDLSIKYYDKVLDLSDSNSNEFKSAQYRKMHVNYLIGEYDQIIKITKNTKDPYFLILRAYSYLNMNKFDDARTALISAQSTFNDPYYNKLIKPLLKVIEGVGSINNYNKYSVLFSGLLFPGGGQFLLKDYDQGKGVVATFSLLMLMSRWGEVKIMSDNEGKRFFNSDFNSLPIQNLKGNLNKSGNLPKTLTFGFSSNSKAPLLIGFSVLATSALSSFNKTKNKNITFVDLYIKKQCDALPASIFMDFPEPNLIDIK